MLNDTKRAVTIHDFENIYRRLYRRMFLYAHDFIEDEEVCRDIVGDVFMKFWDVRDTVRSETVEAYLRASVRNACLMWMRHRDNFGRYAEFSRLTADEIESLDCVEETVEELNRAIDTLPERTRHILELCYLHGKTYREVAGLLGITSDGVKKHIVKAYSAIRDYFRIRGIIRGRSDNDSR